MRYHSHFFTRIYVGILRILLFSYVFHDAQADVSIRYRFDIFCVMDSFEEWLTGRSRPRRKTHAPKFGTGPTFSRATRRAVGVFSKRAFSPRETCNVRLGKKSEFFFENLIFVFKILKAK